MALCVSYCSLKVSRCLDVEVPEFYTRRSGNQRDLPAMHDYLAGKVYAWQVQLAAAMGNLRRADQLVPEDLLDLVPVLANLVERNRVNVKVGDNIGYFGPFEETIRKQRSSPLPCWVGCYAGCAHIGIEADGGVKGCLSMQSVSATEGNLQQQSLADIWNRPGAFAYNRAFAVDDLAGFCRTCAYAEICRGGCLSMRTCEGGRENPFCYHRVATLAAREARKARSRYYPVNYAPAALLAIFGLAAPGCLSTTEMYGICSGCNSRDTSQSSDVSLVDRFSPDAPKDGAPEGPDALGVDTVDARKDIPTRPEVAPADVYSADLYLPEAGIDGDTTAPDTRDGRSISGSEVGNDGEDLAEVGASDRAEHDR